MNNKDNFSVCFEILLSITIYTLGTAKCLKYSGNKPFKSMIYKYNKVFKSTQIHNPLTTIKLKPHE